VPQSAMSRVGSGTAGAGLLADRGDDESRLRRTVVAGPGGVAEVDDTVLGGVLRSVADEVTITAGLTVAGHVDRRSRVLTGVVVVAAVLGLCLFRRENYDLVLARVLAGSRRRVIDGGPPTGQALSTARTRLAPQAMRTVFEQAAARMPAAGPGSYAFGLLVTAFDGTVLDLAATADITAEFATPSGGRFPQARLVTLIACGTRWILAARLGSAALSEQHLVDQLVDALLPGSLNLADRNFFSMARWIRFAATGAHLAWRVKNGARSLPARIMRVLPDGSAMVRLHESDAMLTARRAKTGDRHLPRLPDTLARLVEFTLTVTDSTGRARTTRFRILTTLLDHEQYPADQIAAVYAERWQAEVIYLRVKATLRGAGTRLRGQTPALAIQEAWGLLTVYNALVGLAVAAAVVLDVDPDEISFAAVLALTRASATTRPACVQCGHRPDNPVDDLVTAIAAQPRNRTTRQRTSPRTKTQRRTERTRDVSYAITIVASNLPKDQ
jgi:Insertion element 4 transposase N-terminal/Transposase DDE domain